MKIYKVDFQTDRCNIHSDFSNETKYFTNKKSAVTFINSILKKSIEEIVWHQDNFVTFTHPIYRSCSLYLDTINVRK